MKTIEKKKELMKERIQKERERDRNVFSIKPGCDRQGPARDNTMKEKSVPVCALVYVRVCVLAETERSRSSLRKLVNSNTKD